MSKSVYRVNPAKVAAKAVGQLFLSDLAGGITMFPNKDYDLEGMYGEDAVKRSAELRQSLVMQWVIREEQSLKLKPKVVAKKEEPKAPAPPPPAEPPVEEKNTESGTSDEKSGDTDKDGSVTPVSNVDPVELANKLFDLAVSLEVITEAKTPGTYQMKTKAGAIRSFSSRDRAVERISSEEDLANEIRDLIGGDE